VSGWEDLSSQEVADQLNVSRAFVVKLARKAELASLKVGNRCRFRQSDVDMYEVHLRAERSTSLAALTPEAGYAGGGFRL
jgi:excisionase family DNA binding protein